jgi:selT/selW/selH-like putative selenoprotein
MNAHPDAQVTLLKSGGGVFEITVDGRLGFSKKATGRFPSDEQTACNCGARRVLLGGENR